MSAFRFFTDAHGYVCGGYANTHARSSETWRPPKDEHGLTGVEIQWHGAPFEHITTQHGIEYVNGAPVWASDLHAEDKAA